MIAVPRPSRVVDRTRARLSSPGIAPAVVARVLDPLGLSATGPARNLGGGRRSRNVVVPTDRGRVVIKRYRAGWDDEIVTYGHAILRRLEELDLPGPRLLRTPSGGSVVDLDGATYAAFDLVPGRGYASSWMPRRDRLRLLALAGESLGTIHRGLEGFEPTGRHHMAFASATGPRVRDAGWYVATVEELRGAGIPGAERLVARADDLVERIGSLEARLDARGLPRTVIHGDFGLHNVVFDGTRAVPIDVELARLDLRLTDHVLIVGRFLDGSRGAIDLEALDSLLTGVGRAWPLTADERDAVGDAWRFQQLGSTVRGWWSAASAADPAARVAVALRALDREAWLDAHPEIRERLFGPAKVGSAHG